MTHVRFTSSVLPAHARGVELGERFRDEIRATVATYRQLFERRAEHPDFDVDLWSARAWTSIQQHAPEHADEIAGIAEGAGLHVHQVASVNARTEILVAANPTGQTECSTVVATPPGRPPVAVQTWDWYDAMGDGWFEWTIPHEDGRVVRTVTEYGMLAKIGVNGAGVGVMLNMLHHRNDATAAAGDTVGHPVHLLSRAILDRATSTEEAVRIASSATVTASTSLTVVDELGASCSVELFPGGPGLVVPEDGLLVRTNHFVSAAGRDGCLAATIGPSTEVRRAHLVEVLGEARPQTAQDVLDAMNHHDEQGGVCRHPMPDTEEPLWTRTLATVCLDVAGRSLDVREHGPCGHRLEPEVAHAG